MSKETKVEEGQEQEKSGSAEEILRELIEPGHREATCVAYTTFLVSGVEINFTMREGATAEGVRALLLEMGQVSQWLKSEMKATPVWKRDTRETVAQYARRKDNDKVQEKPAPAVAILPTAPTQATPPPAPTHTTPPPPPAAGAPPPAPGQATAPSTDGIMVDEIDFMRITAPSGKAVVEFWRKGRTYPEVRWQRGGALLLTQAPALAAAGWVAGHFDIGSVGKEYHCKLLVSWERSPKNPKWKDIIQNGIEYVLVQEA